MFTLGVAYLLSDGRTGKPVGLPPANMFWSRVVLGIQSGLILLAMIVTRSSVASLQAKQGLPVGNQVVGWLILGRIFTSSRGRS